MMSPSDLFCVVIGSLALYLAIGPAAAPRGPVFALECVVVGGIAGGRLVEFVKGKTGLPLPPLLGMLVAGALLRNVPGLRGAIGEKVDKRASASLRTLALAIILARAGLGLDTRALVRLRWAALRLAALPCLVEATVAGVLGFVFFRDMPVAWCATLGFVVAAVSPAVVVPSLLALEAQGYGKSAGIPTLVVAAAALDDVFSLAGFGVSLGFAARDSSQGGALLPTGRRVWVDAIRAPLEIVLGVAAGVVGARLLRFFDNISALALSCVALTFGLKHLGFSGASALATLTLATLTARDWGPAKSKAGGAKLNLAWTHAAQPALFSLLGVAVDLTALTPSLAGLAVSLICMSGVVRMATTHAAVAASLKRSNERLFVALAWLPKATVQAAVGAVPLDAATSDTNTRRARIVLAVAVIAIVFTAPLGAVAIAASGPRLLDKDEAPPDHATNLELERRQPDATVVVDADGAHGEEDA